LGLSKITLAPYQIVLYSKEGQLIYKGALNFFELKVDKTQLQGLLKDYPKLHDCLAQITIVKENNFYFLQTSPCLINVINRDSIVNMGILKINHYFPSMSEPINENITYAQYHNFFSSTNPLFELITVGSVPYLLILNSEDGTKVNLPLISNCDIFKELNESQ
jgi:hypothetical protein